MATVQELATEMLEAFEEAKRPKDGEHIVRALLAEADGLPRSAIVYPAVPDAERWLDSDEGRKIFWRLRDGSPQWMTDVVHAAHGDMLPEDWRYEFIRDALVVLSEIAGGDDANLAREDALAEIEADVYTHRLLAWLASHGARFSYCDEAVQDQGPVLDNVQPSLVLFIVQLGQIAERREVAQLVWAALAERAGDDDETVEEE